MLLPGRRWWPGCPAGKGCVCCWALSAGSRTPAGSLLSLPRLRGARSIRANLWKKRLHPLPCRCRELWPAVPPVLRAAGRRAESCQPRSKVVALNDGLVKCRAGQSCHQNRWWFTVCFSQVSYAPCPRAVDDSVVYGDCKHDRRYLWSSAFIKDFFFPSKLCEMLRLCVAGVSRVINIAGLPIRAESFQRCFKELQTNCLRRSGRSSKCSQEPGSCVQYFWLLLTERVWAVMVGFELTQGFWGETSPFLTTLCTVSGQLLRHKKRGTRSWLVRVTGLSPGPGSWLPSKQGSEKIIFFPLRLTKSGSKRCPGSGSCSSWALSRMLGTRLQDNDIVLTSFHETV